MTALFTSACESCRTRACPIEVPDIALELEVEDTSRFTTLETLSPDWWKMFQDDQLTWLIVTALEQNPSLLAARDKVYRAAYTADFEKSYLYPHFGLEADLQRQKLSETGVIPFQSGPIGNPSSVPIGPQIPVWYTLYETSINFSYEIDLWGKRRKAFCAALDVMHAREADEAFRRLSLSVLMAKSYFQLQIAYRREAIQQQLQVNLQKRFDLVKQKKANRLADESTILEAENALLQVEENVISLKKEIQMTKNLILSLLAGDFTEAIEPWCLEDIPEIPLPCSLPLHLLAHRPDIISQIWMIEAFSLQTEVAKAEFYPDFNLVGFIGFQTIHLRKLFESKSAYGVVEPAMTLPIFQGGALVANLRSSEVDVDLAIYQYNELVLNAVREVLDGIVQVQTSDQLQQAAKKQVEHRRNIFELMELKKTRHIASGIEVLQSEAAALLSEDHYLQAVENSLSASLELIKALGGGYE